MNVQQHAFLSGIPWSLFLSLQNVCVARSMTQQVREVPNVIVVQGRREPVTSEVGLCGKLLGCQGADEGRSRGGALHYAWLSAPSGLLDKFAEEAIAVLHELSGAVKLYEAPRIQHHDPVAVNDGVQSAGGQKDGALDRGRAERGSLL